MAAEERRPLWRVPFFQEGLFLALLAAPLLFPTFLPWATGLALLALLGLWLRPWLAGRPPLPVTPFNIVLLVWGLAMLVGTLVSADPDLTLPKLTNLILGLAVWRWLAIGAEDQDQLKLAAAVFVLLGCGMAFIGTFSAQWPVELAFVARIDQWLPPRLIQLPESSVTGVHTNQLAATILLPFFPLLSLFGGRFASWSTKEARPRLWPALGALLFLLGGLLLLTQSRSAWLGGVGGLVALLLLWGRFWPRPVRRWTTALALFLALLVMAGAFWVVWRADPAAGDPQPQDTIVGSLTTLSFRQEIWRWGVTAVEDFPFTGTGLGTFRHVAPRLYPLAIDPMYDIAHAHNLFLQVALDTGLPGLVAYVGLLLVSARVGWGVAQASPRWRPLALGLLSGLVALHVYGLTDALAPGAKPGLLFWLALGLLGGMWTVVSRSEGRT